MHANKKRYKENKDVVSHQTIQRFNKGIRILIRPTCPILG